jgi:hypothetical protein
MMDQVVLPTIQEVVRDRVTVVREWLHMITQGMDGRISLLQPKPLSRHIKMMVQDYFRGIDTSFAINQPDDVKIADFNSDGNNEIVVTSEIDGLSVLSFDGATVHVNYSGVASILRLQILTEMEILIFYGRIIP